MKFRTEIPVVGQEPKIDYNSKIFLIGSCFVENIGEKLDYFKFQKLINPFGIMFHPIAIENFIGRVVSGFSYSEDDIFFYNERWHCFEAHSLLSKPNKAELLQQLNLNLKATREFLQESTHIVVTLGTAWGYRHLEEQKTVANCHKLPQKNFTKELLAVKDIEQSLVKTRKYFRALAPNAAVIFTVSPVRHFKDGVVENQRSKAHLIAALHEFLKEQDHQNMGSYFPSYEIMMDELRDYRFYADDMLHPSEIAIEYIWQRFVQTWLSLASKPVLKEVDSIQKALSHRPFDESSEAHQKFLSKLQQKINSLKSVYDHISFH